MEQPQEPRKRPRRQPQGPRDDQPKKGNGLRTPVPSRKRAQNGAGRAQNASTSNVQNGSLQHASVAEAPAEGSAAPIVSDGAQAYATMKGILDPRLLRALEVMRFTHMTPVQQMVLTKLPTFRSDCLVRAKTGTGKTVAFFLPALHSLINSPPLAHGQVGILVISPTRELALQIAKECDQLTSQMPTPLECHTAFGGMSIYNWRSRSSEHKLTTFQARLGLRISTSS